MAHACTAVSRWNKAGTAVRASQRLLKQHLPSSTTMQAAALFSWVCTPLLSLAMTSYLGTTTRIELVLETAFFSIGVAAAACRYASQQAHRRARTSRWWFSSVKKQQMPVFYYDEYGRRTTREAQPHELEGTNKALKERAALTRENVNMQVNSHLRRASLCHGGAAWNGVLRGASDEADGEEEAMEAEQVVAAERAAAERAAAERAAEHGFLERRFLLRRFTSRRQSGTGVMYDPSPGVHVKPSTHGFMAHVFHPPCLPVSLPSS